MNKFTNKLDCSSLCKHLPLASLKSDEDALEKRVFLLVVLYRLTKTFLLCMSNIFVSIEYFHLEVTGKKRGLLLYVQMHELFDNKMCKFFLVFFMFITTLFMLFSALKYIFSLRSKNKLFFVTAVHFLFRSSEN